MDVTFDRTPRVVPRQSSGAYHTVYSNFRVDDELNRYQASISGFDSSNSTAGDSFTNPSWGFGLMDGRYFHTYDYDTTYYTCPSRQHGAMWYQSCSTANLNGAWLTGDPTGMSWRPLTRIGDELEAEYVTSSEISVREKL